MLNRTQYPSDVIALVVLWRLRYKLSLRDLAEMFLIRGFVFSYEAVRDWEAKLTPALAEELRRRRSGKVGPSWYVDETYIRVHGRWKYLYRAIDRDGALVDVMLSEHRDLAAAKAFFRSAKAVTGTTPDRVTCRALEALNIDIICANSPQAKGRVERAFGTLQDRLVKELRLAGISSIEAANAWLPGFIASHNARFGREPANAKDLHRKLTAADDLDEILAWREQRTVTQNLTLHYDRMMLILEPTPLARGLVRRKVEVVNYPDGRFAVQFNGRSLPFRMFDKIQTVQPGAIVDNKRLSAVLAMVKARQAEYEPKRQRGHVARQRPPNNLDAPGLPSKGRASRAALAAAVT